jgi:hypothetical protein
LGLGRAVLIIAGTLLLIGVATARTESGRAWLPNTFASQQDIEKEKLLNRDSGEAVKAMTSKADARKECGLPDLSDKPVDRPFYLTDNDKVFTAEQLDCFKREGITELEARQY